MSLYRYGGLATNSGRSGPQPLSNSGQWYYEADQRDLLLALGFVTCQTCGGSGEKDDGCPTPSGGSCGYKVRCPDCNRLGVVPSEAMIERAVTEFRKAQTDSTVMLAKFVYDGMRAALLEAFGGDE